ncbi:hypothetical protein [Aliiroseovarius subalbicans]|uniref:hypothetical protein n=1 Tax=Aliiroseovarius subalbicans TaxID=2925840 RepID=UPI001F5658CF|nr:hypothetical protein [Aliiroseovarius subalbicans]MCI2399770.1 hypothetical protein [Aliiroseovarius subalbicans]
MTYQVTIEAFYAGDPDQIFSEACQFSELVDAMSSIATYDGLPQGAAAQGETYVVDVTLFGLVKNPGHTMFVERLDPVARILQSREHNASVSRWDHTLSVQPGDGGTIWTDTVIIEAPRMEWATARFARFVYKRRHKHRRALHIATSIKRV